MAITQYAYGRGKTFIRSLSATFAMLFGFFAIFFAATPRLWGPESSQDSPTLGLFVQNVAHAEAVTGPATGDGGSGGAGDCGSSGGCGPGDGGGDCN